jgi:hypothetical protein
MTAQRKSQLPERAMKITISKERRPEFFDQLTKFAGANALVVRIGPTRPDGEHFFVQMWRSDIEIMGANPFNTEEFQIGFYRDSEDAIRSEAIDQLMESLRRYVSEVPGAHFQTM